LARTENNTRLSGCDVFGSVTIEGNNTCQGNSSFVDLSQDFVVEAAEVGAPIGC